ncbi:MAG: hypothetical protein WBF71_10735 [Microthrixaceae bacterium]
MARSAGRSAAPFVAMGLFALFGRGTAAIAAGLVAVSVLALGVFLPLAGEWMDLKLGLLTRAVATGLSAALAIILWIAAIVPAWLAGRATGSGMASRSGGGWSRVDRSDGLERSTAASTRSLSSALGGRARYVLRLRQLLTGAVSVTVVFVLVVVIARPNWSRPSTPWARSNDFPVEPWSFPGEPWAGELLKEFPKYEKDPNLGWKLQDISTEHITVIDGLRATIGVSDPELTIWMFGGSTTFGVGQRDQKTIASTMVRIAQDRGIRLAVTNFGVPGYSNWQEATEFAQLIKSGERTPPEMAIFYDGANEVAQAWERVDFGKFNLAEPHLLTVSAAERDSMLRAAKRRGYERIGASQIAEQMPGLVAGQYQRGVSRILETSATSGVPVVLFWQPQLLNIPVDRPRVKDLLKLLKSSPEAKARDSSLWGSPPKIVDDGKVVDLTRVFDHVTQPVFFDWAHTNEHGATIVAEAILDHLWPKIVQLANKR